MSGASTFVLGVGLFFLGMQLVGENLRRLSGRGFRRAIGRVSQRPALASMAGIGFGALMQSATAVTFVLASMQRSGLVSSAGAAPVILWSNVGLTALAFLTTLNIHPLVAYFVGGAGILSGMIRQSQWRTVAGGLLGVGLILLGLESMGAGAEPLRSKEWFQTLMNGAVSTPALAFVVGIGAAAVLQSNTGAAMLVITLAESGIFKVEQAALLIYGTNLGAIGLRIILSINLDRASQRLVRFEDLFCVVSGVLMLALAWMESLGVPGPIAFAHAIAGDSHAAQLAILFLLSNAIPALVLCGFTTRIVHRLERWMPGDSPADLGRPKYLSSTAIHDPETAADLALHESSRLLGALRVHPADRCPAPGEESSADPAFLILSGEIEHFLSKTTDASRPHADQAHILHLLRAELGIIRYLEEAVREFNEGLCELDLTDHAGHPLAELLTRLLETATAAALNPEPETVTALRAWTKRHNNEIDKARSAASDAAKDAHASTASASAALIDAFDLAVWMLHRLAKILDRYVTEKRA